MTTIARDLDIVGHAATALVYQGLDEDTAIRLVESLTDHQRKVLILALVKMMARFDGMKP